MLSDNKIHVREFSKSDLGLAQVVSGVSPKVLRRVFIGWLAFAFVVAFIVLGAPQLSEAFVGMTFAVLALFTFAIFGQSRISEGWPTIIMVEGFVGVVQDPHQRQFIMIPCELIVDTTATKTREQRKVVEIHVDQSRISEEEKQIIQAALWPHADRVVGMVQYRTRASVVKAIKSICMPSQSMATA